jgi:hypothetical protein
MKTLQSFFFTIFLLSLVPFSAPKVMAEIDNPLSGGLITRIYFSHVAVDDGWQTEIAIINPTPERATGRLVCYSDSGVPNYSIDNITLEPHGRYELDVRQAFAEVRNLDYSIIDYMIFTSSTFGLTGYSKFYKDGVRASIMASGPRTTGLFSKIDHEGWTGIAFIEAAGIDNTKVSLTAYTDDGTAIAQADLTLEAGDKVVKEVNQIFSGTSLSRATYVSYTAEHGVVGFFLNGSGDGLMLDGSQAQ